MSADGYRTPDVARLAHERANELARVLATGRAFSPPHTECPACSAPMEAMLCANGHASYRQGSFQHKQCGKCLAPATKGPVAIYCSPMRRLRWGFLWLKVCKMAGSHLHQECRACGWRGFAAPLFAG